jgi:hypothetical protein
MRSISDLSNQITTLSTQQQQMQDTITHNTQLTQQNWGLTSAMQYDVSNIFLHMGLDHQLSQPYYQPQQYSSPNKRTMTMRTRRIRTPMRRTELLRSLGGRTAR